MTKQTEIATPFGLATTLRVGLLRSLRSLAMTLCLLSSVFCPLSSAEEGTFHFQSRAAQNTLIEFYTSENLKSCNAAEEWFNQFRDSTGLFAKSVPLSFHLDKWDDRAWKDKFAIPESTERFRAYSRFWNTSTLYAPAIVVNGVEWNGWSRGQAIPPASREAGILSVDGTLGGEFRISFAPIDEDIQDWTAHAALLGCEMESRIRRGENEKQTFIHEFVTLAYKTSPMRKPYGSDWKAVIKLKFPPGMGPKRRAVAVWVSRGDSPVPFQATGRYFPGGEKTTP